MKKKKKLILLFLFSLSIISCDTDDRPLVGDRGEIINYKKTGELSKEQVIKNISEYDASDIARFGVSYYVLEYSTIYVDRPINTRGLLLIPHDVSYPEFIAYFHGTHPPISLSVAKKQAPSTYDGSGNDWTNMSYLEVRNIGLAWASAGYAVFLPDYIGYGTTADKEHPYIYYPELFKANVDGIIAALSAMDEMGYGKTKDVLLTGWSQGGGAALSAHKLIQEQYSNRLNIIATSALAGPYNFVSFLNDVLENKDKDNSIMHMVSWAAYSLNKFSDLKRPTDQIFSYPVYDQMASLTPPSKKPAEIFNNFLVANILSCEDLQFWEIVKKNSFHKGWRPTGKVFLHHGDADDTVPYYNSVEAYEGLKAMGGDITLHTYKGGSHKTELNYYVKNTLKDFAEIIK
ncbi:lipase family protein [Bacteroidales bacterium OttesenSCG-928-B11]|nr:lipase family protein [Bacteroidales bacterium OttesenSCG-928-E04]MDL2309000.1 lipase family protein [Bacteroidales bacterium OttesenSCG-928-C03]MDL2312205.1 lipase family protein [Bacteroidales bacterium OttesenSCG-928-B11]MDL2326862.1 lipase family protein [Bacteroidales bacterium OttesenSCG-928-A14]